MLNIAICDDSQTDLALICQYLKNYQNSHTQYEFHVDTYQNAETLLEALSQGREYEIFFLDILMPGRDGISLAQHMRSCNFPGLIIFLTSSPEYSLDAFRVKAMQYLLKPVSEEDFFGVLDDASEILRRMTARYLTVSVADGKQQLRFSSIVYVECKNRILYFHMADGKTLVSRTIRQSFETEIQPLLSDYRFCRPHQSFIINMTYASRLLAGEIIMEDGSGIPIAKNRIKETRKIYLDFLSSQMPEL